MLRTGATAELLFLAVLGLGEMFVHTYMPLTGCGDQSQIQSSLFRSHLIQHHALSLYVGNCFTGLCTKCTAASKYIDAACASRCYILHVTSFSRISTTGLPYTDHNHWFAVHRPQPLVSCTQTTTTGLLYTDHNH